MIRMKEFMSMIACYNKEMNIMIFDDQNEEIDYDNMEDYINRYIDSIEYIPDEESDTGYTCLVFLLDEVGNAAVWQNFIKYDEIIKCFPSEYLVVPVDFDTEEINCEDTTNKVVINITPSFFENGNIGIGVILSNTAEIIYLPMNK